MAEKYGTLYVCATPIGNLGDITIRALEILKACDYIAAEDTRHTLKLLNHYNIKNRLISCHEHNEKKRGEEIVSYLKEGKDIALVSDAGMPAISDPGAYVIALCAENGIKVTVCPGASAAVSALVLSGFSEGSFVFEGFLPKSRSARKEILEKLALETRTVVLYESPHGLRRTLQEILDILGDREIALVRELTKLHEEVMRLNVSEAITAYDTREPKGEYVLVLKGAGERLPQRDFWNILTIEDHVEYYLKNGNSQMDAIKKTAKDRGRPKSEIYKYMKG